VIDVLLPPCARGRVAGLKSTHYVL
jgi:hypothetical protein